MKRALEMFVIEGIKTSIPLHRRILAMPISPPERSIRISLSGCWERTGNSVMRLVLPRLYVILDATLLKNSPYDCAEELAAAVSAAAYRDKSACARDLLELLVNSYLR